MALHVRHQIRNAIRDLLIGLATTGSRVYTGQIPPLDASEMPGLIVSIVDGGEGGGEQIEPDTISASVKLARTVAVQILGYVEGIDAEDKLDRIAFEVEEKLGTDWEAVVGTSRLGALCHNCIPVGTEIAIEPAQRRIGEIRITYQIIYRTARSAPGTAV